MKGRFVIILVLINCALVAAAVLWGGRYWVKEISAERAAVQKQSAELEVIKARMSPSGVVYRTNWFQWSAVESPDYRKYIANLRGVGCPESTIKDIILADVMKLYAARRGEFYQNGRPFHYWETNDKRKLKARQVEERERELAKIDKELPLVLRELLGINYERELNKYFVDTDEDNRRLEFLTENQRSQVLALRDQIEGRREAVIGMGTNGALTADQVGALKQIDADEAAQLSAMLPPDVKTQYEMTMSPVAERLRQQLIGFNPTEDEFRELYQREEAFEATYAYADTNNPDTQAAITAERAQMESSFRAQLSPDRAAQYDLSKNPDYQTLCVITEAYDLPAGTSQAMVEIRQNAEAAKQQLLNNADVAPENRAAALQAIEAETEKTARVTMGNQAFEAYAPGAEWLRALGTN